MAALDVFKQVGRIADSDFLALEVLPILWAFSLGPLLNLEQFQKFMNLIKSLSTRIEREHSRRIQELTATNGTTSTRAKDFTSFGAIQTPNGISVEALDDDFEALVLGRKAAGDSANNMLDGDWSTSLSAEPSASQPHQSRPTPQSSSSSWSRSFPTPTAGPPPNSAGWGADPSTPAITPDANLNAFTTLTPSSPFNNPLQPSRPNSSINSQINSPGSPPLQNIASSIDWSATSKATSNPWVASPPQSSNPGHSSMNGFSIGGSNMSSNTMSNFSLAPHPTSQFSAFSIAPPPSRSSMSKTQVQQPLQNSNVNFSSGGGTGSNLPQTQGAGGGGQKQGLDKYESLL